MVVSLWVAFILNCLSPGKELEAIKCIKSPTEIKWVYSSDNDFIGNHAGSNSNVKSPDDWVALGKQEIIDALHW